MANRDVLSRLRYRLFPDHVVGEILSKNWIDTAIPAIFLVAVLLVYSAILPSFMSVGNILDVSRQLGEITFIVLGLMIVMMAGGIDLSVGSTMALTNFVALALMNMFHWPLYAVIPTVMAVGCLVGLINGVLIGYLRLRAFLTTLAMLIIIRAVVDTLGLAYGRQIGMAFADSASWDYLGIGFFLGVPVNFAAALVFALIIHIVLTRVKFGWHVLSVGGSRRSAHNAGISVRGTVCMTYVISGFMTSIAGLFYAARLTSVGSDVGVGTEITALTAAVLGGVSLGGGRGSVSKALLGTIVVVILTNGLLRLQLPTGSNSLMLGVVMLLAVGIDVKWVKNRYKLLSRIYVSPTYGVLPPMEYKVPGVASPYKVNDTLYNSEPIGLDVVDGAEDIAFDEDDNLYTGSRHGDILRFFAPDYKRHEVYVHIGGQPLAVHFSGEGELHTCVGGMGLYKVTKDREVVKLSDETNRSWFSVIDDSRMRLADDMDFAPDGKIYFSEATIRYDMHDWTVDALEMRGNGRLICYDPKDGSSRTIIPHRGFPNGVCMTGDGESFLFAESWLCKISRYWFSGPKRGTIEIVTESLPGYPDNLRRASDGSFWVALVGMRTPALDLACRMPGFRKRMAQRLPFDEWLHPNINTGCVVKIGLDGSVKEALWDTTGEKHPMVTSMREHKGYLYLGGIYNNRLGRIPLTDANPGFVDSDFYREGSR
jgi:ribose transport system permease protein